MSSKSFPKRAGRSRFARRPLALLLALVLLLALLPKLETEAEAAYYDEAIQKLIGWDVLRGYPDGSLHADSYITRAEFVALINRAYGYGNTAAIPFNDVPDSAWYYGDISAAYAAGYFTGTSPVTASPSGELTREQAMVLLARNMRLDERAGEVTSFSDGRDFQSYSAGYANTAVAKGLVSGYSDGSFRPENSITRGEMAVMLSRALGSLVNSEGTYALGDVFGNVTVNSPNVTLRNTTIAGDLYLTGGLGLGGVTLENVRVLGDIIVAGGGESDEGESVILRNVTADTIRVDTLLGEYVSLRAEGDTNIGEALLISDAYLQDRTASGLGFKTIRMEGEGGQFSLSGNLEKVVNAAPYSLLRVSEGIVQDLTMDEAGVGASLWLDATATVLNLTLDTATAVAGRGDVRKLNVNVPGTNTEMLPDEIEIRPGLTGVISGENMDSAAAAEASSEPRLLANYPRMINVAATSATATFSTNKSGTIYWAVTSISDGSVNEEALLTPAARGSILKSGNLAAAQSNTVYSVNITGLTSGGNYYLTAMLRDARGDYSPIKVASFSTTDNSTPAFGSGHPYMSEISDISAWATVMATKNCQLYWVVFDKGSSAPTVASFRAGAFSNSYGYGVMDMQRNISATFPVNNLKNLEELKSYDVYFWLNDADSAKSSAVRKLSFTTMDKTPPEFNVEPTVTNITATSLRLTTNVNEAGTVYWVIVEGSEEYPKQPAAAILERDPDRAKQEIYDEYFKLQIANGMNGLKAGSVKVRANTDATINITGLKAETQYKIYYLAKDNAGNYSLIKIKPMTSATTGEGYYILDSNYIWQSTLDENPPSVRQEFTHQYDGNPYADTNIQIVFSERVQYHDDTDREYYKPLYEAYVAYKEYRESANPTQQQRDDAEEYLKILHKIIKLYSATDTQKTVNERTDTAHTDDDDWVIDYRYATVAPPNSQGEMIVTFPTTIREEDGGPRADSALNLNSDATYYFMIDCIADTSTDPNDILDASKRLPNFTTIAAQVELAEVDRPQIKTDAGTISTDAVYSMKPVSVSRADPTKRWDMLIWSDHSVKFNLYRLEKDNDTAPTDADKWELVTTVGGDPAEGMIDISGDYQYTYRGISYWWALKLKGVSDNLKSNPYIRDESNTQEGFYGLVDGQIYYYAIEVTDIGGDDPDHYTGNVKFWITVDTGTSGALKNFCDNIYLSEDGENGYKAVTETQAAGEKLTEISVCPDGSDRFIITAHFNDGEAPDFVDGFPEMNVTDTSLTVRVKLDRAGKVYYAVEPAEASYLDPTRLYRSVPVDAAFEPLKDAENAAIEYSAGSAVHFDDLDVPYSGNEYGDGASMVIFYDENGSINFKEGEPPVWNWYPLYVSNPNWSIIYGQSSGKNEGVQYFSENVEGNLRQPLPTITGLSANTEYYIYFLVESTGGARSDYVQMYKFKTEEAYRPPINLSGGYLSVDLSLSYDKDVPEDEKVDALTDYALFQYEILKSTDQVRLLSNPFYSSTVMGANMSAFETEIADKGATDMNGKLISEYTVYEAIQYGPSLTESYFDVYATASYKEQIRRLITNGLGGGDSQSIWQGHGTSETVDKNDGYLIECGEEFKLDKNVEYYVLTASRYANAVPPLTGNSYTFRAYSPIKDADNDPPRLERIYGNIDVYYTGTVGGETATSEKPIITGTVYMDFDKNLQYYDGSERHPIHLYFEDSKTDAGSTNYTSVEKLSKSGNGITIQSSQETADRNKTTDEILLGINNPTNDCSITFQNIASDVSGQISFTFRLNLNAGDTGAGPRTPTWSLSNFSGIDADRIWAGGENFDVTVQVHSDAPQAKSISLSPTNLDLDVAAPGSTSNAQYLAATINFEGGDATKVGSQVKWEVISSEGCSVTLSTRQTDAPYQTTASTHTHRIYITARLLPDSTFGTAEVKASYDDGSYQGEDICTINIFAPPSPASFSQDGYQVKIGETLDLSRELRLSDDVNAKSILWESDKWSVATVSASQMGSAAGLVRGVSEGTAEISATITTGAGEKHTVTATVTVSR